MPPHHPFSRRGRPIRQANRLKRVVGPSKKISRASKTKPHVWAEVNLRKLRKNLKMIRSFLAGRPVEILAVVKADAYGHGIKEIARVLKSEGVSFFGVANLEEALELRKVCQKESILVLGSFHADQLPLYSKADIITTVSSVEDLRVLSLKLHKPLRVHVKIDTGMGRLGVWHEEADSFFKNLKKFGKNIILDGVYTHFSSADSTDKRFTEKQIRLFEGCVKMILSMGFSPRYFHAANSMGLARFKKSHLNLVRPGILLYGVRPRHQKKLSKLQPILELKTRVSFLKHIKKGRPISYGATYRARKDTRVATLPIGYSHGFRLGFSNKGFVIIRGNLCPVVGRVTMDQTVVDVGHLPKVKRWDEATLIGRDGGLELTVASLADMIGTIPYEIFCSIHQRIPRIYKEIRR